MLSYVFVATCNDVLTPLKAATDSKQRTEEASARAAAATAAVASAAAAAAAMVAATAAAAAEGASLASTPSSSVAPNGSKLSTSHVAPAVGDRVVLDKPGDAIDGRMALVRFGPSAVCVQ